MKLRSALLLVPFAAICACDGSNENIHFITSSEIGIGVDPALGTGTVGYDRNELVITTGSTINSAGDGSGNGGQIPALYAELQSNRLLTQPEIIQIYATGRAAARITSNPNITIATSSEEKSFKRIRRRAIIFGTTTNLGLKVAVGAKQSPSFNLGYKRREASRIPIDTRKDVEQTIPSLFAYIRVNSDSKTDRENEAKAGIASALPFDLRVGQLIATGVAAENIAASKELRKVIGARTVKAATAGLNCEALTGDAKKGCKAEANSIVRESLAKTSSSEKAEKYCKAIGDENIKTQCLADLGNLIKEVSADER